MKFICMEDIENLAAQGKKELVVDENTVVMELARDLARQKGIAIVTGAHPVAVKPVAPTPASSPVKPASPVAPAASKPRGCQHGPLPAVARSEQPKTQSGSDGVVDQLVDLVRQSMGKRSGN